MYFTMIKKTKNGKWRVDVTLGTKLDGSRDRRVKHFDTKTEAEKYERSLLVQKDTRLVRERITIDEFIETIFWKQKKNLRASTKRCYERDIRLRILPAFSGKNLEDINRYGIQEMISSCATKKVATNARETLSSILSLAYEMELIPKNPAGYRYQYPKRSEHEKDYYGVWLSTFAEHREFLQKVEGLSPNPMLQRILILGLCFGLRRGEIFGLDWEGIDLENKTIHIYQTYVEKEGGGFALDEPKTAKSNRYVPMPDYACSAILSWREEASTGAVITIRSGKRMDPTSGADMLKRFLAKHTELPRLTIYSLRHSFATACINAGIEVSVVSAWLGHREVSTTYNRYVKPLLKDMRREISVIDAAFGA